jgi:hypothetical protein
VISRRAFQPSQERLRVSDKDWAILEAGPDHELYWDTWSEVEHNVIVTSDEGVDTA